MVPSGQAAPRRKWKHRAGDQYQVLICRIHTTPAGEFEDWWTMAEASPKLTIPEAKGFGFYLVGSDDFNVGAFRDGKLAAVLWMDEIVDDEPEVLTEVAEQVGCEAYA